MLNFRKYYINCKREALLSKPELMHDKNFLSQFQYQLLHSQPKVVIARLSDEVIECFNEPYEISHNDNCEEQQNTFKYTNDNGDDTWMCELKRPCSENPLTFTTRLPPSHCLQEKVIRFEVQIPSDGGLPENSSTRRNSLSDQCTVEMMSKIVKEIVGNVLNSASWRETMRMEPHNDAVSSQIINEVEMESLKTLPNQHSMDNELEQNVDDISQNTLKPRNNEEISQTVKIKPKNPPKKAPKKKTTANQGRKNKKLSQVMEDVVENTSNVINSELLPPVPKKRQNPKRKKSNCGNSGQNKEVKSDLARFVEDFSYNCSETRSTSSTPKVSSTTQNAHTTNMYDDLYEFMQYLDDDAHNETYNNVEQTISTNVTQDEAVNPNIFYLPNVVLESNEQYSMQPLPPDQSVYVWDQQGQDDTCTYGELQNIGFEAALSMPTLDDFEMPAISTEGQQIPASLDPYSNNAEIQSVDMENLQYPDLFEELQTVENSISTPEQSEESHCVTNMIDLEEDFVNKDNITIPLPIKLEPMLESDTEDGIIEVYNQSISIKFELPNNKKNNEKPEDKSKTKKLKLDGDADCDTLDLEIGHSELDWEWDLINEEPSKAPDPVGSTDDSNAKIANFQTDTISTLPAETVPIMPNNRVASPEVAPILSSQTLFDMFFKDKEQHLGCALHLLPGNELNAAYRYQFNRKLLFLKHFNLFCEVYAQRNNREKLFCMILDCGRYHGCGHFLQTIFTSLVTCGFSKVNACRHILKRTTYRLDDTIDNLVNIIMEADWTMFHNELLEFSNKDNYKYSAAIIDVMVPKVVATRNQKLQMTLIGLLFNMSESESVKISDQSKQLISNLATKAG